MGSKIGVRHYFIEGLTARGYISLLPILMPDWQRLYMIGGGIGTGKSTFIKLIGLELLDRGYEVDFFRSALDPDALSGFVVPKVGLGMLNQMEIRPIGWRAPGVIETGIDLSPCMDERKISAQKKEIVELAQRLNALQGQVEKQLEQCLPEQDKPWTKKHLPYYADMGWFGEEDKGLHWHAEKAGPWSQVKNTLKKLQMGKITPCFLHGLGSEGWVNLAPHFLADSDQIRLEGEETLDALNWAFYEAQQLGQVMNIVLHPLNPNEVIGIVFPERNLAIWQGNPKSLTPQESRVYTEGNLKETLIAWHNQRSLLKKIYTESMDFSQVGYLREQVLNRILRELDEMEDEKKEFS